MLRRNEPKQSNKPIWIKGHLGTGHICPLHNLKNKYIIKTYVSKFPNVLFRLLTSDLRHQTSDIRPPTSDFWLQASNWNGLATSSCTVCVGKSRKKKMKTLTLVWRNAKQQGRSFSFRFRNTGDTPLEIEYLTKSRQKTEVRYRKTEVGNQKPDVWES